MVDQSRRSPLHYAVEKGLTRIVQVVDGVGDKDEDDDDSMFFIGVMQIRIRNNLLIFIFPDPPGEWGNLY